MTSLGRTIRSLRAPRSASTGGGSVRRLRRIVDAVLRERDVRATLAPSSLILSLSRFREGFDGQLGLAKAYAQAVKR
jgi:hypothetical protein